MKLSVSSIVLQAWTWLAIPVLIWITAWLRPAISIPLLVAVVGALAYVFTRPQKELEPEGFEAVSIDGRYWLSVSGILGLVLISGIGGYMYQPFGDHGWRNAVFNYLVTQPWPVNLGTADEPSLLCYYFGFWLPAGLTAKIFGVEAGWLMQTLYALWGLTIVMSLIFARFGGRARLRLIAVLILFSGMSYFVFLILDPYDWWQNPTLDGYKVTKELASYYYHNNSVYTNVGNIYNSAITSMVGCALMYFTRKQTRTLILAYSLMFIGAPFPCAGLLPVMAAWTLMHFRKAFTWQNAVGILIFLTITAFFLSNNSPQHEQTVPSLLHLAWAFVVFFFFEFGIYMYFVWHKVRRDPLFWALLVIMTLAPLLVVGHSGDFGWRAPIPFALYMLYRVMEAVADVKSWKTRRNTVFAVLLCLGAIEPLMSYGLVLRRTSQTLTHTHPADMPQVWPLRRDYLNETLHTKGPDNGYYDNFFADGKSFFTEYMMHK